MMLASAPWYRVPTPADVTCTDIAGGGACTPNTETPATQVCDKMAAKLTIIVAVLFSLCRLLVWLMQLT